MPESTKTHRTTIEIDVAAFREAREVLGTDGYKTTVNQSLREVGRNARLRRAASLIRSGDLGLSSPEDLQQQRRPRFE